MRCGAPSGRHGYITGGHGQGSGSHHRPAPHRVTPSSVGRPPEPEQFPATAEARPAVDPVRRPGGFLNPPDPKASPSPVHTGGGAGGAPPRGQREFPGGLSVGG